MAAGAPAPEGASPGASPLWTATLAVLTYTVGASAIACAGASAVGAPAISPAGTPANSAEGPGTDVRALARLRAACTHAQLLLNRQLYLA